MFERKGHAIRQMACILILSTTAIPLSADQVERFVDPETDLVGWKLSSGGLEVELIQRLPIQSRAFFEARGFPLDIAHSIGEGCVMQTIVRNAADSETGLPINVDLSKWSIKSNGKLRPIKLKAEWLKEWEGLELDEASKVAFRWSTFPSEQTFLPGDYNWGMTTLNAAPGSTIDVKVVWQVGGEEREGWIYDLECAVDRE